LAEDITNAILVETILGAPYAAVEEAVTKLDMLFPILQLPDFTDNLWQQKHSIVGQGVIHSGHNPEKSPHQLLFKIQEKLLLQFWLILLSMLARPIAL